MTSHGLPTLQTELQRHWESGNLKMSVSDGLTGVGARDAYASKNHISKVFHISVQSPPRVSIIPGATWGCNGWPWPSIGVKDGGNHFSNKPPGCSQHHHTIPTHFGNKPPGYIHTMPCSSQTETRESKLLCFQQSRQRLSSVGCSKPRVWCQLLGSQRSIWSQHQTLSVCLLHHFHWHQPSWCSFHSALAVDNNQPPSLNISSYFCPFSLPFGGKFSHLLWGEGGTVCN